MARRARSSRAPAGSLGNRGQTREEQRNRAGRETYSPGTGFIWREHMPVSAGGRRPLTIWEPPPQSWPGGHAVFEPLLAAGRDTAGGECLRAGRPQAPGGHVPAIWSQTDWITGIAPQSCFNERPRGLSAPRVNKQRTTLSSLDSWAHELHVRGTLRSCRCPQGLPKSTRISLDPATWVPGSPTAQ